MQVGQCFRCEEYERWFNDRRHGRRYVVQQGAELFVFDVDRAWDIVSDGRQAYPVPGPTVLQALAINQIVQPHVAHVLPGAALVGYLQGSLVFMDGTHRLASCYRANLPCEAFVLTEQETRGIIIARGFGSSATDLKS